MRAKLAQVRHYKTRSWFSVILTGLLFLLPTTHAQSEAPLHLDKSILLSRVKGRIDHMAVDLVGQRLFIAALGNNTLEIVDLVAGVHLYTVKDLVKPQGVALVPELNRIFVTNGDDGSCRSYDAESFNFLSRVNLSKDADNIRYDPHKQYIYVGYGAGALGRIEARTAKRTADIPLAGHPESFQLEETGSRIFVNVPTANHVAVIDREELRVIAKWPVEGARGNFPMALDEDNHRLFIACREPAKVIIYATDTGKSIGSLDIAGDADDMFIDRKNKRLYVSCGEGFLYIFRRIDADGYQLQAKLTTAPGARTSLFVPEQGKLYLAVPHRGKQKAEIRVYTVGNDPGD